MKLHTILILATAASMSSCSVFQSLQQSLSVRGDETGVVEKPVETPSTPELTPATTATTPSTTTVVKTEAEKVDLYSLKQERIDNAKSKAEPEAVVMPESKYASILEGEWYIISVKNKKIDRDEDMPYIYFETKTGNFYANNGCNTLNGSYSLSVENTLQFHNVLSTMQFCPDVDFEGDINSVISDEKSWNIALTEHDGERFIDFIKGEKSVMRLRRGLTGNIDGLWSIESIAGVKKLTIEADIFFDTRELKLHGNSGCNYFNGEIYLDHRIANAVDFSDIIITSAACPDMDQETALLVALQQAAIAVSDGEDHLVIFDDNSSPLLTLKRIHQNKK